MASSVPKMRSAAAGVITRLLGKESAVLLFPCWSGKVKTVRKAGSAKYPRKGSSSRLSYETSSENSVERRTILSIPVNVESLSYNGVGHDAKSSEYSWLSTWVM